MVLIFAIFLRMRKNQNRSMVQNRLETSMLLVHNLSVTVNGSTELVQEKL